MKQKKKKHNCQQQLPVVTEKKDRNMQKSRRVHHKGRKRPINESYESL